MVQRWREAGAAIAADPADRSRLGSLEVSFKLTSDAVAAEAGALDAWTLGALFPSGVDERVLEGLEEMAGWSPNARLRLVRHHIWVRDGNRFTMLPPIGRHAIDKALAEEDGFSWMRSRPLAYAFFAKLGLKAESIESTDTSIRARALLIEQFTAILKLLRVDSRAEQPLVDGMAILDTALRSLIQFRPGLGLEIARAMQPQLKDVGLLTMTMGSLERRLGQVSNARTHFIEALRLLENDRWGKAHTLKALADLKFHQGEHDSARDDLLAARELYEQVDSKLGMANCLRALGDVERVELRVEQAREYFGQALEAYREVGDTLGRANTLLLLGNLATDDDLAKAEELASEALSLYKREQIPLAEANAYQLLGDIKLSAGNAAEALDSYTKALAHYEDQDPIGHLFTQVGCARCHGQLGNDAARDAALITAWRTADAYGSDSFRSYVKSGLRELLGGHAAAEEWLQRHQDQQA